jgi:hypothetical protein
VGDGDLVDVKWEELPRTAKNKNKKRKKKKIFSPISAERCPASGTLAILRPSKSVDQILNHKHQEWPLSI